MDVHIAIPVSLLLISIAWCPKVRKLQIEPRQERSIYEDDHSDIMLGGSDGMLPQGVTRLPAEPSSDKNARAKATIISGLVKLVTMPFVAALFCRISKVADLGKLHEGFEGFTDNKAFPYFMVQIIASLVGYVLCWLACSMRLQRVAFALPLVLATPVSMVITLAPHLCNTDVIPFECGNPKDVVVYVLAFILWSAQLLSTGYYMFKDQGFIMEKESSLFWLPVYNGQ